MRNLHGAVKKEFHLRERVTIDGLWLLRLSSVTVEICTVTVVEVWQAGSVAEEGVWQQRESGRRVSLTKKGV